SECHKSRGIANPVTVCDDLNAVSAGRDRRDPVGAVRARFGRPARSWLTPRLTGENDRCDFDIRTRNRCPCVSCGDNPLNLAGGGWRRGGSLHREGRMRLWEMQNAGTRRDEKESEGHGATRGDIHWIQPG